MMMNRKGITLVALIVTIVVLLILAGITINLTIGEDGIIRRAEEAAKNYTEAAENEETQLAEFTNLTDKIIDKVTQKYHTMVKGVPVPNGFEYVTGEKDTGFVIRDITTNADGTPSETNGNEFVWIPCTIEETEGSITYNRYAFTKDGWVSRQTINESTGEITRADYPDYVFTEVMPSDEKTSVQTYGGFYIGRYEAGVKGETAIVQKGVQVWNYITRDEAKEIAEGMYANLESVTSRLCSSYAWDTALKFIDTKNTGYATSSAGGNYYEQTFSYTDLNGETQTKAANTATLVPTGQTTAVNNIYDMGGNTWEWTTEVYSDESNPYTIRGGPYNTISTHPPAASRRFNSKTSATDGISFRPTLYL